jgi:1,4-alpha-glucan branching enzyme
MIKIKQNGQKVWVTFTVPSSNVVDEVSLAGEWNDWQEEPMKLKKNGEYSITKVLKAGNSFQFGYKSNSGAWMTDEMCPAVPSPFASQNSLLEL